MITFSDPRVIYSDPKVTYIDPTHLLYSEQRTFAKLNNKLTWS